MRKDHNPVANNSDDVHEEEREVISKILEAFEDVSQPVINENTIITSWADECDTEEEAKQSEQEAESVENDDTVSHILAVQ